MLADWAPSFRRGVSNFSGGFETGVGLFFDLISISVCFGGAISKGNTALLSRLFNT